MGALGPGPHPEHTDTGGLPHLPPSRRGALALATGLAAGALFLPRRSWATEDHPNPKWYSKAREMQELAETWGDQSYGAVLVLAGKAVGLGPSRVVKDRDTDAHAERVAIREAQKALGTTRLAGSVLYSTSRPCPLCESAAAKAGVIRMYHGALLSDAGQPRLRDH